MILKAYLHSLPPERREVLERFLPETQKMRLEALSLPGGEPLPERREMLDWVHWSWFLPTLKSYPLREQKLFLSALNSFAADNLSHELEIEEMSQEISETAKDFFKQILINSLTGHENRLLPIEFLPPSPLKPLLGLSKKELTRLIDFLSLYDLAFELRQIVETKILKKIYSFLSEEERKFLKQVMAHQKEPFAIARMGLDRWDGNEESLRTLLHRRGIARFAAALSGQDPDFIWYICHQLDIGRGNALYKSCAKEAIPQLSDAILRQIEEILAKEENK